MSKFYDSNEMISIRMTTWDSSSSGYTPDWEADFFNVGCLPYDEDRDAYKVDDVQYLIDEAKAWEHGEEEGGMDLEDYREAIALTAKRDGLSEDEIDELAQQKYREDIDNRCVFFAEL